MKNKKLVIAAVVVSLLLVGGVAMASFDENGNFVNPFTTVLSEKVSNGELTQAEVDTFNKVFEAIEATDGLMMQRGGMFGGRGSTGQLANSDALNTYTAAVQVKVDEVFNKLVTDGILTQEQADQVNVFERGKGFRVESTLNEDLTDEQCDAVEAAMDEIHDYMTAVRADMVSQGLMAEGNMRGNSGRGFRNQDND
ncbi:MAG: hypothetical protein JXQ23_11965 [Clostridia bacterium]|nr:hypothetical protein [Clostridia bacterium]